MSASDNPERRSPDRPATREDIENLHDQIADEIAHADKVKREKYALLARLKADLARIESEHTPRHRGGDDD